MPNDLTTDQLEDFAAMFFETYALADPILDVTLWENASEDCKRRWRAVVADAYTTFVLAAEDGFYA